MNNKALLSAKKTLSAIEILLILTTLGLILVTNVFHYNFCMNSDIAAEAILGKVISETKQLIPSVWFSSTETRVISASNLAGLFNILLNKMNLSMGLACFVTTILTVLAEIFMCRKWELDKLSSLLLVSLSLIIPSTMTTLTLLYVFASYYGTCFIIYIISIAILSDFIKKGNTTILNWLITCILAFLLGLQGMRGILVIYFPLLIVVFLITLVTVLSTKKMTLTKNLALIWAIALILCSYLGTKLPISTATTTTRNIRKGFHKLFTTVIPSFANILNIGNNPIYNILISILCLICIIELVTVLRKLIKVKSLHAKEIGFLVTFASPITTALIVAFTTVDNSDRYYFMIIFAIAYSIPLFLEEIQNHYLQVATVSLTILFSILQLTNVYSPILNSEEPRHTSTYEVTKSIMDRNIKMACSTFEHANSIMCLSDGEITVRAIDSMAKMNTCLWLTSQTFFTTINNEPIACVATDNTLSDFESFLSESNINVIDEYTIDIYHIFILEHDYL